MLFVNEGLQVWSEIVYNNTKLSMPVDIDSSFRIAIVKIFELIVDLNTF